MLKRLSGLDTVFLAGESPGNWLHIMAILLLDPSTVPGGYAFARFRDDLAARLRTLPPMRRRLLEVPMGLANPVWIDDPDVDFERHIRRAAVPEPGGPEEIGRLAADMLERPLDRRRPLWEMLVVEGVAEGRIAVIAKLHHAMMDGVAGMQHMASLLTREPDAPPPEDRPLPPTPPAPDGLTLLRRALPRIITRPLRIARATASTLATFLSHEQDTSPHAEDTPSVEVHRTWLNAHTTPERSVAYGALSLDAARDAAHAMSATVNDVVLAAVGGALRRELSDRGVLPAHPLVAAVPVSTHAAGDDLANAMSVMFVGLGTDVADAGERLRAVRDATCRAKHARAPRHGAGDTLRAWAEVPRPLEISLLARLTIRSGLMLRVPPLCNLVVSNVPGPPVALHLGGARLVGIHPLGPIFDGIGLNVTVLSHDDRSLDFGIVALGSLIRDPWPLAEALRQSFDEVVSSAGARSPGVRASPSRPADLPPAHPDPDGKKARGEAPRGVGTMRPG
jgi:WS/DGAT/MGAT family acyltransferase